ncbi:PD-(D/E)XK motif protein [Flectobacillus sp. BAB-3569]|uniref:PD-(D/E)XK motif protein n=1 Tax=Flectobacillus sp. BAB-3569 TaxID=1509483 RepID=UPI000BA4E477|nr:PD-(D/E)XK motif protein [Flectobacillus sp. BAB-3569]PAC27004.1 hypothetical protein BWI92_24085 [Flectobacillus sp. BAB-3569]
MNLFTEFLELDIPRTNNSTIFNVKSLEEQSFAKIGVNSAGFPIILISTLSDPKYSILKNINLKYIELSHNVQCILTVLGQSKTEIYSIIVFKSTEKTLINYFCGCVSMLICSISGHKTPWELNNIFNEFIEIFRQLSASPMKTVQGLWSELFIIERSSHPDVLIQFWHLIPENVFDFEAGKEKIEVKSSSSLERIHFFSSEQLNASNDDKIIVASIFTRQISDGISILELIERIRRVIKDHSLIDKVYYVIARTLGNTLEHSISIKYDYELANRSIRFFEHQEIAKINRINIPENVSSVRFKSDLTNIRALDLAQLSKKGILFRSL